MKPANIAALQQQLDSAASKQAKGKVKELTERQKALNASAKQLVSTYSQANRGMTIWAARLRISTSQINSTRDAMRLFGLIIRDSMTKVGALNVIMNIMISRFGTMILIFGAFRAASSALTAAKDGFLQLDNAIRKVASLVIPTSGDLREAMKLLTKQMVEFGLEVGISFKILSDTMFFLASAGLDSVRIFNTFEAAQRLVIGTSKDMVSTMQDNKAVVEVLAGLYNVFGDTMKGFNTEQEKAEHIAGILFKAFQTNQILISELAVGLTFAASQAKLTGVSIEQLVASLAVLNTNMVKGSKAGTSFANALRDAVRKADQLNKIFDVDISGLGTQGFDLIRFLDQLKEGIDASSNKIRTLTDLMKIFNIRGLRSMIVLTDQLDQVKKLLGDMVTGQEALDAAVKIASESMAVQLTRQENIKAVISAMLAIAISGGSGFAKQLQEWNFLTRKTLPVFAAIFAVVGELVFAFKTLLRVNVAIVKSILAIRFAISHFLSADIDAIKKKFEELDEVWDIFAENVKQDQEGINILWGVARDRITSIEDAAEAVRSKEQKIAQIMREQIDLQEEINSTLIAANKSLSQTVGLFDKITGEQVKISATPVLSIEQEAKILKRQRVVVKSVIDEMTMDMDVLFGHPFITGKEFAGQRVFGIGALFQETLDESQAFTKKILKIFDAAAPEEGLNKLFAAFEIRPLDLNTQLENLSTKTTNKIDILRRAAREEKELAITGGAETAFIAVKLGLALEDVATESVAKLRKIYLDDAKSRLGILDVSLKEQLNAFKSFAKKSAIIIRGIPLAEVTIEDFIQFKVGDIIPDPRQLFDPSILEGVTEDIRAGLTNALKSVQLSFADFGFLEGDVDELNAGFVAAVGRVGENVSKVRLASIKEFGVKRAKLTRSQQEDFLDQLSSELGGVNDILIKRFNEQQEILIAQAKAALFNTKGLTEAQRNIVARAIVDLGSLNDKEIEIFNNIMRKAAKNGNIIISEAIKNMKRINEELIRLLIEVDESGAATLNRLKVILNDISSNATKDLQLAIHKTTAEFKAWIKIIDGTTDSLSSLVLLFGNEFDSLTVKIADGISIVGNGLSDLLGSIGDFKIAMNKLQGDTDEWLRNLTKVGFAFTLVGIIASSIQAISSIIRERDKEGKKLEEEFLPDDATRRIAQDFGQSRVVNQRITLTIPFQLLDPSQLTESVQRRITLMVFEQLKELELIKGGAVA